MSLTAEKLAQAAGLLNEADFDVWLTFVRETSAGSDPVLPLILDGSLTWISALIVTKSAKIAVVGNYDADAFIASGEWDLVVPYVQGIREPLLDILEAHVPAGGKVGINYSTSDDKADGITYGMQQVLASYLVGTRFEQALVSAEKLVQALRGVKSSTEVSRMRNAIAETVTIFGHVPTWVSLGSSERELSDRIQGWMEDRKFGYAWSKSGNPIVNFGPDSMVGHGVPSPNIKLAEGQVLHIDLGLIVDDYASDLQRCWFVGETVPSDVTDALSAVNAAISAAASVLRPGALGVDVDAAARASISASGYDVYQHAVGHQVGRVAHDGGGILGPAWERYGKTPFQPVRAGQVYTLELGVNPPGRGYIGIEEMVLVTDDGIEWLSDRQLHMPAIPPI